jgi:hypothetical protein
VGYLPGDVRSSLVLLLFGALVAGCSHGTTGEDAAKAEGNPASTSTSASTTEAARRPEEPPPSGRDLAWLRRLHRWELNLARDGDRVGEIDRGVGAGKNTRAQLRKSLVKLTRCEKNLLRQVREPNASRYRGGFETLAESCRALKRLSFVVIQSLDRHTRVPSSKVSREGDRSRVLFNRGSAALEGALRANRDLDVSRGSLDESKIEPRLSGTVSRFVLHKPSGVEVRCWSKREWKFVRKEWGAYVGHGDLLGFVHDAELRISVAPRICKQLARLVYRRERPGSGIPLYRASEAVRTLAHEAEHIRNRRGDEAATECRAMQRMARVARVLGTSRSYGDLLASTFWSKLYAFNLPTYRSSECRDGGALDIRRGSDAWPS